MITGKTDIMPDFCNRRNPFHYVTALNLLSGMGIDIDNISILAEGEYENYKGEIRSQEPKPGTTINNQTRITLVVGFSSAVDFMPYQFFYGLFNRDTDQTWEQNARSFMAPYDAAVIRHEALAKFLDLKYDFGIIDPHHFKRVLKLFDFELPPHSDNIDEMLYWLSILPSFHFWAGNPKLCAKAMEMVFGHEFEIVENCGRNFDIPDNLCYRLGQDGGRLGCETLMGNSFTEFDSGFNVIVKNVELDNVSELLPGGKTRDKLDWFLQLSMPGNLEYDISIRVRKKQNQPLTENENGNYLGYSTFI
jgi:hypothetical protein